MCKTARPRLKFSFHQSTPSGLEVSQSFAFVLLAYPLFYSTIRFFSPRVMTPLQSSQEADSPLLLLSSSAPGLAFYLSSTFTPLLHLSLFSTARPLFLSLIHPCHGALVTCLAVTMATCIQAIFCWNPWETQLDPCRSPEGRGEGRVLTQLW